MMFRWKEIKHMMTQSKSVLAEVKNRRGSGERAGIFGGRQILLFSLVVLIMLSGKLSVRQLTGAQSPQQAVKIRQVKVQGNQAVGTDTILNVVRSRSEAILTRS